jgi:diacylglycerol kinase (ATP)
MHADRPLFIVNPSSGRGSAGRRLPALLAAAERVLGDVDVAATQRSGHAIELAERGALEGRRLVVAVGGDGTFNEVCNGLLRARAAGASIAGQGGAREGGDEAAATRVGLIAAGTGADVGRTLGVADDLEAQVTALATGRERAFDVARARFRGPAGDVERHFVNVLSAGPGGLVDTYVRRMPGWLGGAVGYNLVSLLALVRCPRARVHLTCEGPDGPVDRELSTYLVAVCNGRVFGGGMRIAPMAQPDDGVLELILVSPANKRTLARKIPTVYRGTHLGVEGVEHLRCRAVRLELLDDAARQRFLLDVDGEPLGSLPVEVDIVPGALVARI